MRQKRLAIMLIIAVMSGGCGAEDQKGWNSASLAWMTTIYTGVCLRDYERANGRYPADLSALRSMPRDQCLIEPGLLSPNPEPYMGFDWRYVARGPKQFVLEVTPHAPVGYQCVFHVDEGLLATRTCPRKWLWPRVDTLDLTPVTISDQGST